MHFACRSDLILHGLMWPLFMFAVYPNCAYHRENAYNLAQIFVFTLKRLTRLFYTHNSYISQFMTGSRSSNSFSFSVKLHLVFIPDFSLLSIYTYFAHFSQAFLVYFGLPLASLLGLPLGVPTSSSIEAYHHKVGINKKNG